MTFTEMARNSEKRLTGLNRFLEAKQKEEKQDSKRPPLHRLHSAEEVKKWIPSITKEINYLLQQISGTRNYPDRKIEEFKASVDELKKEHGRFVSKVRGLDPSYKDTIPWEPRAYQRKRPHKNYQPVRTVDGSRVTDEEQATIRTADGYKSQWCGSHVTEEQATECVRPKSPTHDSAAESVNCDQVTLKASENILNLDYSSSESSDSEDACTGQVKKARRTYES